MSAKKTILVIDDEEQFREAAVNIIEPILPEDWEIEAPTTLEAAMQLLHDRIVRIALIDRNINGDGYQPLSPNGIDVETTSGVQVASWMQRAFPYARRVAYSKGGLGCAQFNGFAEARFPLKQYLTSDEDEGNRARLELREFILEQIDYISKHEPAL